MSSDDAELQKRLRAVLIATFGSARTDAITPLPGGASTAFPFRVTRDGRSYVLRLEGERSPLRNPHQYASMTLAAEAGLAPHVYHADEAQGVAVMDFIETRPLSTYPGGAAGLAQAVGTLIARLQEIPSFPRFVTYTDMVGRLWTYLCGTGLFAPGVLDAATERLACVREAYEARFSGGVAAHNDLLPRNLLFDGNRLWLIDWESAYRNDPHIDIAIALDNFAADQTSAALLQQNATARWKDPIDLAQLAHARALVRLYYAGVLLCASFAAQGALEDRDLAAPSAAAFTAAITAGQLEPDGPATKHMLGKIYLASFMTGAAVPALG